MRKRRERIEKWRAEKKKKEIEMTKKEAEKGTITVPKGSTKAWNLEDDEDEEEAGGEKKDDEVIFFYKCFINIHSYNSPCMLPKLRAAR